MSAQYVLAHILQALFVDTRDCWGHSVLSDCVACEKWRPFFGTEKLCEFMTSGPLKCGDS